MSKRKGVSAEEKKTRLLQLFYEKREFFQLKDLEKIAPKEKGIIANSVKDTLDSLVDNGLVDTDKIGTSIYFWAFPSKAKQSRKRKLNEFEEYHRGITKKLTIATEEVNNLMIGKEKTEERQKILEEITDLQIEHDEYSKRLKQYEENNPEILSKMEKDTQIIKEAANRWTDNIFQLKTWCKNKFSIESDTFDKQFGLPADFDYLE